MITQLISLQTPPPASLNGSAPARPAGGLLPWYFIPNEQSCLLRKERSEASRDPAALRDPGARRHGRGPCSPTRPAAGPSQRPPAPASFHPPMGSGVTTACAPRDQLWEALPGVPATCLEGPCSRGQALLLSLPEALSIRFAGCVHHMNHETQDREEQPRFRDKGTCSRRGWGPRRERGVAVQGTLRPQNARLPAKAGTAGGPKHQCPRHPTLSL